MSNINSSADHLTLNADGAGKDIKFQANGVEKASISSAGAFTSTSIDATKLSGALPAIDGSALTGVGKVLQVVSAELGSSTSTSSTSFVDTGLSVSITPISSSSSLIILFNGSVYVYPDNRWCEIQLTVGGTVQGGTAYMGVWNDVSQIYAQPNINTKSTGLHTASVPITIKARYKHNYGGTLSLRVGSSITVMEIGA